MVEQNLEIGVILDDVTLTLHELAIACKVEPTWIIERVQDGTLVNQDGHVTNWRFTSAELVRAKRLIATEKTFDANAEELDRARRQLKAAGII